MALVADATAYKSTADKFIGCRCQWGEGASQVSVNVPHMLKERVPGPLHCSKGVMHMHMEFDN